MPWSDLNIVVTFRIRNLTERDVLKHVEKFKEFLSAHKKLVDHAEVGERKNISILKLTLTEFVSSKRTEVIFRRSFVQSLPKTESIIRDYLETYPITRMLYFLVRKIFHTAELDDPADGGINGFAIFLMIVAFVQKIESSTPNNAEKQLKKANSPQLSSAPTNSGEFMNSSFEGHPSSQSVAGSNYINCRKVGEIFLNFIYFYGFMFDYSTNYIHTYVSKFSKCNPFYLKVDPSLNTLMILNPFDHNLIITKSFKKTAHMKQTFRLLYNNYFAKCSCRGKKPLKTLEGVAKLPNSKMKVERLFIEQKLTENWQEIETFGVFYDTGFVSSQKKCSLNNLETIDTGKILERKKGPSFRSRLSSKSNLFAVVPVPGSFKPIEDISNPFGFKLQAMISYNFL